MVSCNLQAMTELERRSSSDLLSRGEGKQGLRQRRDKEQMVAEHGAVTQSLQVGLLKVISNDGMLNGIWQTTPVYIHYFRRLVGN